MKIGSTGAWTSVALGVILALVLLCWRGSSVEVVYPAERARVSFVRQVWTRFTGLFEGASAKAENVRLRRELAARELSQGEVEKLERENARLRRLLDYSARHPKVFIPAAVLSSEGGAAAAHAMIRVDKGSLHGISKGAVVVVPEGLVGRVTSVSPHTAEVTLLMDPTVRVACEVELTSAHRPRGVVAGGDAEKLVLKPFFRAEKAVPGMRVVTSGIGGIFPQGLFVGTYLGSGMLRPAVDFSTLEDVFIYREK